MTACGGSSSTSTAASSVAASSAASSAAATNGSANIGVCIYQFADNFMTLYRSDLEEYLKDMGYSVTIMDGKNDQNTQTEQINTFLQQGVDVLVINPEVYKRQAVPAAGWPYRRQGRLSGRC